MPVVVIAVSMLVMLMTATLSAGSPSCMSRTEARRHFGTANLYWHGRHHCWNARQPQRHYRIAEVQPGIAPPDWREPMAAMLPADEPAQQLVEAPAPTQDRPPNIEPPQSPIAARWVDIAQVRSPPAPAVERKPEPKVTPRSAVLAFIAIVLMLGTIEVLFRCTSDEHRHAGRDTPPAG